MKLIVYIFMYFLFMYFYVFSRILYFFLLKCFRHCKIHSSMLFKDINPIAIFGRAASVHRRQQILSLQSRDRGFESHRCVHQRDGPRDLALRETHCVCFSHLRISCNDDAVCSRFRRMAFHRNQ